MSGVEHLDAWKAAVDAVVAPWLSFTYSEIQELKDKKPAIEDVPAMYVLVSVSRRAEERVRMCGGRPVLGWRMQTLAVGTTVDEVEHLRDKIRAGLMDKRLPSIVASALLPDGESDIPEKRGDRYQALDSWTYNAPNPSA